MWRLMTPKNILITGSSSGIGLASAQLLAAQGHHIWLLNRNPEKSAAAVQVVLAKTPTAQLTELTLDLNELASVAASAKVLNKLARIDVLINNAGGLSDKRYLTADGYEQQFQQNHLGHFALTTALMPLLLASKATVINVSSEAHRAGRINFNDLQGEKSYSSFARYAEVKLMNILFTKALHQRFHNQGLNAFALHPGVVNTRFGEGLGANKWMWKLMSPFLITPEKGAATTVYLATNPPADQSGNYFKKEKVSTPARTATHQPSIDRLWEVSEQLLQNR